jgi:hypothetical protein
MRIHMYSRIHIGFMLTSGFISSSGFMDCWTVHIASPPDHRQLASAQMSDSDVIDTAAAVNDAVQAAAVRLGLQQTAAKASDASRSRNKRAAPPHGTGPIWDSVTVTREHDAVRGARRAAGGRVG